MFPLSSDLFCAMLTVSKGMKLARSVLLFFPPGTLGGQLLFVAPSGEEGRPMVMTYSVFIQTGIFLVALINLVYQIAKKK